MDQVEAIENHLSAFGNCLHPPLKEFVLKGSLRDTTPLLLACADGNLVVVKHMIERWGVDVRASATYYHLLDDDEDTYQRHPGIEGATPLFVAAVNGHVDLVRYLNEKGANVSSITSPTCCTYGNMTPLHGALILIDDDRTLHVESPLREMKTAVVQLLLESGADPSSLPKNRFPTWMTNLCNSNITAISALINYGMSLEQWVPHYGSFSQPTVLHHWASNPLGVLLESRTEEESPLVVVKLLVEKGANVMALDNDGLTPILRAAHGFLVHSSHENFSILNYLLERDAVNRKEKIDAMELIGAIILSTSLNDHLVQKAFDYWHRALHQMETGRCGQDKDKTTMKRKSGLTTEWITEAQLDRVIQHPSEYPIQSFLVRLRIYSSKSWKAVSSFIQEFFNSELKKINAQGKFTELLDILLAILEMIDNLEPLFRPDIKQVLRTTTMIVKEIVRILSSLLKGDPSLLKKDTIKSFLEILLTLEQDHLLDGSQRFRSAELDDYLWALLGFIEILAGHPELLNEGIKELLVKVVQLLERPTYRGQTLLIMACGVFQANSATINLLLNCAVDPNVGDSDGNGPLHHLLNRSNEGFQYKTDAYATLRLLLNSGAHLDRVNKEGKTAVVLWTELQPCGLNRLPEWCYETVPQLKCLSSRIVRSHNIPFTEETLPVALHKFVEMH